MKPVKKKTILCIDDEPVGLSIRKLMLEASGYRVLTAECGLNGLAIFQRRAVDLVILDYRMPGGMDGDAVAREIKRIRPFVPVIILTAYPDLPRELLALVNKFLIKGEDPGVLLTMIEELLETCSGPPKASPYEKIINDAVHIMRSDFASIQMLHPKRGNGELQLLDFRGFNPEAAVFWEWVRADSKSTCGIALRDQRQVIAPDVASSELMADSEDQQVYLQTGILACQTTPLIARGEVVGMISTHWRTPINRRARIFASSIIWQGGRWN